MKKVNAFFLLVTLSSLAQTPTAPASRAPALTTAGYINGRTWRALQSGEKILYLTGFAEALLQVDSPMRSNYIATQLSTGEAGEAVDRFYAEPENLPIPVTGALVVVTMRANGAAQSSINDVLSFSRRLALSAPEQQKK